jgi:HK97 family phage portal protein
MFDTIVNDLDTTSLVQKEFSGGFAPGYGPGWTTVLSSAGGYSSTGVSVNIQSALQLSSCHACLDRIASDIAKLPIILMKRQGDQYVREHDHYLLDLLNRPNHRQTGYEMRYQMIFSYQLIGNGYAVVIYGNDGVPQAILPMPVGKPTSVIEKMSGVLEYVCTNPMFRRYKTSKPLENTARRTITEDEMIHLRRMSLDGVRGTSVISTASEVIGLGLAAQSLAATVMKNGATFNFIITTPLKLTAEQVTNTQNDFVRNLSGVGNAGKPPIMHGGTGIEKVSMTPAEAQLLEARDHIDAEVCRLLGVPHSLLGIATGDTNTYKNLEQDMRAYVDGTLMNIITPFEDLLNQKLLFDPNGRKVPKGGAVRGEYRFQFDVSALLRADRLLRYQSYAAGVTSHVLTPNEARAEEGLPPLQGGDQFVDQSRTVNVNNNGGTASTPTPADLADDDVGEPDGNDE